MFNEEQVRQIIEKVLSSLNTASFTPDLADPGHQQVMVVITGATIGAQTALEGLARLKEQRGRALDYIVLFSRAAAGIHKPEEVGKKLKASEVLVEGISSRGRATAVLKHCSLVAVPALTRNTAARTALMLLDSAVTEVLIDALMRGLPVVAAKDAADPTSEGFARLGMNLSTPALIKTMAANLEQIAGYGVTLTSADDLGGVLEKKLRGRLDPEAPSLSLLPAAGSTLPAGLVEVHAAKTYGPYATQQNSRRLIITRADLNTLVGDDGVVRVSRGAMVSPLARDIIQDSGWRVEEV